MTAATVTVVVVSQITAQHLSQLISTPASQFAGRLQKISKAAAGLDHANSQSHPINNLAARINT